MHRDASAKSRSLGGVLGESVEESVAYGGGAALHPKFEVDVAQVGFDGANGQSQACGDGLVARAFRKLCQHVILPFRQHFVRHRSSLERRANYPSPHDDRRDDEPERPGGVGSKVERVEERRCRAAELLADAD